MPQMTPTPPDEEAATPLDTRLALLARSKRGFAPVRHTFVQKPRNAKSPRSPRGSTLAALVNDHQERALDALLILLGLEPVLGEDQPLEAAVWARALSDVPPKPAAVSRVWLQLESRGLVERDRRARRALVRPRREDGKARYTRPGQARAASETGGWARDDWYFILPHAYWGLGLDQALPLAAKAMLLVSLQATSQNPSYYMRLEDAPSWYGLSEQTAARGIRGLREAGLLREHYQKIAAPVSPTGQATRTHYTLLKPFSTEARHQLQAATKRAVRRNAKGPKKASAKGRR